jgi:hypothetical protein
VNRSHIVFNASAFNIQLTAGKLYLCNSLETLSGLYLGCLLAARENSPSVRGFSTRVSGCRRYHRMRSTDAASSTPIAILNARAISAFAMNRCIEAPKASHKNPLRSLAHNSVRFFIHRRFSESGIEHARIAGAALSEKRVALLHRFEAAVYRA